MKSKRNLYKNRYLIVFYDKTDEDLLYIFNNVRDILSFMKKEPTTTNINLVNVELCRALKSEEHFVKFLTGEVMRVYITDAISED